MAHDALGAYARDELGISDALKGPIRAALASAGSFAVGAAMPLLVTVVAPDMWLITLVSTSSLLSTRGSRSLGGPRRWRTHDPGRDTRDVLRRIGHWCSNSRKGRGDV